MSDLKFLTRIKPLPCGKHDPAKTYAINSIVMSENGSAAYLSVQDVPAGIEITNADYWTVFTDVSAALDTLTSAVRSAQTAVTKVNAAASSDELFRLSNGHFSQIKLDTDNKEMITWKNQGTADAPDIVQHSTRNGSDYIACPKRLFLRFTETTARIFLYFYNLVDGVYVPDWTILGAGMYAGTNRIMNYLNSNSVPSLVIDLPDGMYMQASVDQSVSGDVLLYGWDGVKFGPAVSGITQMVASSGETGAFKPSISNGGVVIPGNAVAVICTSGTDALMNIIGVNGKTNTILENGSVSRFYLFTGGYEYYMARFAPNYVSSSDYEKSVITGELGDRLCVFCEHESEKASARAIRVLERARKICNLRWTPKADLKVVSRDTDLYRAGVTYNGIPYGGDWALAHFVGWHVSLHTFLAAANDPDSIFYAEKIGDESYSAPYYSLVCSAMATLAAGWPYPTTNAGFVYDPNVIVARTNVPSIGSIWSNVTGHCVIPERIDQFSDGCSVSAYEQKRPSGMRTTRYSTIGAANEQDSYNSTQGEAYYDSYGISVHHRFALAKMNDAYMNFDKLNIKNGAARPYRGDESVYTSENAQVLINIKDASAAILYLIQAGGDTPIEIEIGAQAQIDVKGYLNDSGTGTIYYVYTDTNPTRESFEYVDVSDKIVKFTATGTTLNFSRNDFWYALVYFRGNPWLASKDDARTGCNVPANGDGDYSAWFRDGAVIDTERGFVPVKAVFYKGTYGAYTVPIQKAQ